MFYQELRLESLRSKRWLRKLCLLHKVYKNKSPSYLYNLILDRVNFILLEEVRSIIFPLSKAGATITEVLFSFLIN